MQADGFHPKLSICGNSTGLDSTTAFEILLAMRVWATETGGTVLATLLQVGHDVRTAWCLVSCSLLPRRQCCLLHLPGLTCYGVCLQPIPEVYNLFDQVLLLQDSHLVYCGARESESFAHPCVPRRSITHNASRTAHAAANR